MLSTELMVELSSEPIDVVRQLAAASGNQHGATTMFLGSVRDHDPQVGQERVVAIEYSAHPEASATLQREVAQLAEETLAEDWSGVDARVVVIHRIGPVQVGEPAMLVIVSTAHRHPGSRLVPALVERIKATAPIWKRQILADGSSQWSNLP